MTKETLTGLSPAEVVAEARRFFTDEHGIGSASVDAEGDGHILLSTFRSQIAVSAFPDPHESGATRVRVSTLRSDDAIGKFLTRLRLAPAGGPE